MDQIKRGASGRSVIVLQYLLGLSPTGTFDDATDKAVRVFQDDQEIKADGIVGPITWGKLAAKQGTERRRIMPTGTNPVRAIQTFLAFTGKDVDGKFGPVTESAVKYYQGQVGIKVDGVVGVITWTHMLTDDTIKKAPAVQPKDFKQYDSRWRNVMYSRSNSRLTISNNGCGPTAMADIVAQWWDNRVTPVEIAALAVNHGYCAEQSGTYRSFFAFVASHYKAAKFVRTGDTGAVKSALLAGAYVVALMGKGYWTGGGHYITLWKYDPATDRIYANDPGSSTRKYASAASFDREHKEYFIFYK
jgi:peptidoglycan hydrolase-like protein with peptidoglycan-binding domain